MASLSSQLSEAEKERIRLQSRVEQLQRDLADAEEGEPLLPMREPFHVPSLPTCSVRPLEVSRIGVGLCPVPRVALRHISQWCPPVRGVDSGDLWGLLNLPILYLLQFHLRPAAACALYLAPSRKPHDSLVTFSERPLAWFSAN